MHRFLLHRLALKIAAAAAVAGAIPLAAVRMMSGEPASAADVLIIATTGVGTYAAVRWVIARRLRHGIEMLRSIRQHQTAPPAPVGSDELADLLREVARTGGSMEDEIRKLKQAEGFRREYVGDVSHELKTPIFAIHGYAETLLNGGLEDEEHRRSFVERILRNARRLRHLTDDLSDIADIESGVLRMARSPFDVRQLGAEVCESLEILAERHNVSLRAELPSGLPLVVGDRDRIRQVLVNLVENAVKYNVDGGEVMLRASRRVGPVQIQVLDTGIGIAPEDVPRVTERFFRVDRSRSRREGGTGLGLAIVKHILSAHGTALLIESEPGAGSTFSFDLPAHEG